MSIFEKASRKKLRFSVGKGDVSVEALWDLPLQNPREEASSLDGQYKLINRRIKEASEESFLAPTKTSVSEADELRLELVKHVMTVKMAERDKAAANKKRRQQRTYVAELIAKKEAEKIGGMELDQLHNLYAALGETDDMEGMELDQLHNLYAALGETDDMED